VQRGDTPLRPRMFWPRPHRLEGHAGRAIPAPSTLHKGLVEARAIGGNARRERKANGQRTSKRPNRPPPWPMLRNATVSEEDNHARFCSPAFRNRFHWWNG
jgi:hypothetical protein